MKLLILIFTHLTSSKIFYFTASKSVVSLIVSFFKWLFVTRCFIFGIMFIYLTSSKIFCITASKSVFFLPACLFIPLIVTRFIIVLYYILTHCHCSPTRFLSSCNLLFDSSSFIVIIFP